MKKLIKKLLIIPLFSLFILIGINKPVKADDDFFKKVDFLQSQIIFEFMSINNNTVTVRIKNIKTPDIIEVTEDFNEDYVKAYSLNDYAISYGVPHGNAQRYQVIDYNYNNKVFTLEMSINQSHFFSTINSRTGYTIIIGANTPIEFLNTEEGLLNLYNQYFEDFFNIYYKAEGDKIIRVEGQAPDNDYNFNYFGEPSIGTAYANRLYYSTGLGRVPVISNELFVGYNNTMIEVLFGVFFYDGARNGIGSIIINCGNSSDCENSEGYGEKFSFMANSIDYAYNFAIYLDQYDIDYDSVGFIKLEFLTRPFPTAQWHEYFKNDLYFSFNYEHSFLRINLYQQGYEKGFEEGEIVGRGIATGDAYDLGYRDGYKEALKNANVDSFYANFDKWIVPAIIIVVVAGIFVGYRRERYGNE